MATVERDWTYETVDLKQVGFRLPGWMLDQLQTTATLEYRSLNSQAALVFGDFIEDWNARQFLTGKLR
jgi:hypothetical protein